MTHPVRIRRSAARSASPPQGRCQRRGPLHSPSLKGLRGAGRWWALPGGGEIRAGLEGEERRRGWAVLEAGGGGL